MHPWIKANQKQPSSQQHGVQPKCAVVLIRKTGVRSVRVQTLHKAIDEPMPVVVPLIERPTKKSAGSKLCPSRLAGWQIGRRRVNSFGDLVQKSIKKTAELADAQRPEVWAAKLGRDVPWLPQRCASRGDG